MASSRPSGAAAGKDLGKVQSSANEIVKAADALGKKLFAFYLASGVLALGLLFSDFSVSEGVVATNDLWALGRTIVSGTLLTRAESVLQAKRALDILTKRANLRFGQTVVAEQLAQRIGVRSRQL